MSEHRVLLVVGQDGSVAGALETASAVVIADVQGLDVMRWQMVRVGWDQDDPRDAPPHDRVCAFLSIRHVEAVVAGRVDRALLHALDAMGVVVFQRAGVSARAAAVSAASALSFAQGTR